MKSGFLKKVFSGISAKKVRIALIAVILSSILPPLLHSGEIHDAVKNGEIEKVIVLINKDPELVCSRDDRNETPLHIAAANGQFGIAELLLASHADPNAIDNTQDTPLHDAAYYNHEDIVKLLIEKGAKVNV